MTNVFWIFLTFTALTCHRVSHAQQWGAGQPQSWGVPQAQSWGMPQMRQRMNLEYGICSSPMVITVCIEGSMARDRYEFRHLLNFTGLVVSALNNLQPRQIATAINYCSYVKDYTPWTTSKQAFVTRLKDLEWPYYFRPGSSTGRYGGGYPGTGAGYGAFSPLQPNSGLCLERARQAFAQVPPYYQRLLIHFTSGRSSNPLLAMQHAQAAMYEGTEIFAISLESYGLSEELRMSVSGLPYLMRISSLNSLSRRHLDKVIQNVCRVERKPVRDSPTDTQTGTLAAAGASNADTASNTGDTTGNENESAQGSVSTAGNGGGTDIGDRGTSGSSASNGEIGGTGSSNGGLGGTGSSNGGIGGTGSSNGGIGGTGSSNGGIGGVGTNNGGTGVITGGASSGNGGVGGVGPNNGGLGGTGTGSGGVSGGVGGGTGRVGTSRGGIGTGTGRGSRRSSRRRGNNNGGNRGNGGVVRDNGGSGGEMGGDANGSGSGGLGGGLGGAGSGGSGAGGGVGGTGGVGGGTGGIGGGTGGIGSGGSGGVGGVGGSTGGIGGGTGGIGGGTGGIGGGTGGIGGGTGGIGGGTGGIGNGGVGGGIGGIGGANNNGGSGGVGGIGGGTGNGAGGVGTGNSAGGSGGAGGGGGGGGGGNNNNNNNPSNPFNFDFPSAGDQLLCVPVGFISNPFLRQLYLAGRRPCPIVTMRPLPTIRPAGCIDVSSADNDIARQAMLLLNYPRPACPVATQRAPVATIASPTTQASDTPQCIDLSAVPQELHEMVLVLNAPLEACANSTNSSSSGEVTMMPTTATPVTRLTCVDLNMYAPEERLGAVILLSLYGISTCPLDSGSGSGGFNSTSCFDVSGFSEEQRGVVSRIIQPLSPCNEDLEPTVASPVSQNTTVACVNISSIDNADRETAIGFITSRSLEPCDDTTDPGPTSTSESSCVDLSIYTTPEDRARAIEFFELYNITICPDNTTNEVTSTASPGTNPPLCVDVSVFPIQEQPGAVVFLSLYGIEACPITNSSSGTGNANTTGCIDISGFTDEQKSVIVRVIRPSLICNETLGSISVSSLILNTTLSCVNVSGVLDTERNITVEFLVSRGLLPCGESFTTTTTTAAATTTPATPGENCVDISIYSTPEERQNAIEYFTLYNITICPENITSEQQSTASPLTNSLPCVDVSIFPVNEQPGAVVFLSLYGILVCPLSNSSSGANGTNPDECVDLSGFTEEQKAVIIEIIKPSVPCPESQQSGVSNVVVLNTTIACVKLSGLDDFNKDLAVEFMLSRGLPPCDVTASDPLQQATTTSQPCVDVSGYTTPQDRADAIEFFTLYNISICPLSTATEVPATPSSPCIDVSIFPLHEQPGAVVFLSLYGIPACPLTNISIGANNTNADECIDISAFTEEQKAVIVEIIKPFSPCNETVGSTAVNIVSGNTAEFCVNLTNVNMTVRDTVIEFMVSQNISACGGFGNIVTTPTSPKLPCIDVSMFPENEQSGAAIFLSIYGLTACPFNSTTSQGSNTNYTRCIDVSSFSADQTAIILELMKPTPACNITEVDGMTSSMAPVTASVATTVPSCIDLSTYTDPQERASAVAFFELYGYTICDESTLSTRPITDALPLGTTTDQSDDGSIFIAPESEPCLDVSIFPEHERANAVVFLSIYRITACPLTNSTSSEKNCIDLSGFTEARKAIIVEMIKPAQPCNESTATPSTQAMTSSEETTSTQTGDSGSNEAMSTTAAPCVNISTYEESERAVAIEFFRQYGIEPCEDISITVTPTPERNCVDLSEVVPALRQFVLAMNAPLEACDEVTGVNSISIRRAVVSRDAAIALAAAAQLPPPPSSAELCSDCKRGADGSCYNPDPSSCSSFLQCSSIASDSSSVTWTHDVISCPPRTLWSQATLTCSRPEDSTCFKQNCTPGEESKMVFLPRCPQYLHCDSSGIITRQCCPLGQVFVNGACRSGILSRCRDLCLTN